MRESKFERYKRQYVQKAGLEQLNSLEDLLALLVDGDRPKEQRHINPTQLAYCMSAARFKAYMGAAGVAKTTTGVADVIMRALLLPGSKWFIARRDYNDLKDTTMRTFERILGRLPQGTMLDRIKEPPMKVMLRPIQISGHQDGLLPSEITFLGLSDQVRSYEFNGGFIDEVDEVERVYVDEMKGRMRYQPYVNYPETGFMLGMAFNPPVKAHWLYPACTGLDENDEPHPKERKWLTLFQPKPDENHRNLNMQVRKELMETMSDDLRQRLERGEWGSLHPGAPVIREYSAKLHRNDEVRYAGGTLFRFWDFGYNRPYVCLANVSRRGHVEVFAEMLGYKQEIDSFIQSVTRLCDEHAKGVTNITDYGDPAVAQHKDTGNALAILNKAGIQVRYQRTPFELSLSTMRTLFGKLIDGRPAIQINGKNCPVLNGAVEGGYCFKEDGVTPRKDGYYDHPVDALRYGIWNLFGASLTAVNTDDLPDNVSRRGAA